jgi:Skp family chaperone for outer membrane proteins
MGSLIFALCDVPSSGRSRGPGVLIAVLDSKKLKEDACCFAIHKKLAAKLDCIMVRLQKEEESIRLECEKAERGGKIMKGQKKKNMDKIESKWVEISQRYKQEVQNIRDAEIKVSEFIKGKLDDAISYVAKEKGVDIVLNTESRDSICVFFYAKKIDLTDPIVQRLNSLVPNLEAEDVLKW